jgi:hypothetical protein
MACEVWKILVLVAMLRYLAALPQQMNALVNAWRVINLGIDAPAHIPIDTHRLSIYLALLRGKRHNPSRLVRKWSPKMTLRSGLWLIRSPSARAWLQPTSLLAVSIDLAQHKDDHSSSGWPDVFSAVPSTLF